MEKRRELRPPGEAAGEFSYASLRRIHPESKLAPRFRNGMLKVKSFGALARHDIPRLSSLAPPLVAAHSCNRHNRTVVIYQRNRAPPMKETPCEIQLIVTACAVTANQLSDERSFLVALLALVGDEFFLAIVVLFTIPVLLAFVIREQFFLFAVAILLAVIVFFAFVVG